MTAATAPAKAGAKPSRGGGRGGSPHRHRFWVGLAFLAPALVLLGALLVYPTIATVWQSFLSDATGKFAGLENYRTIAHTHRILTALKNTAIWVAAAPAVITGLGLIFALLTERVRYGTAIKVVLFMPMAVSFLATGVIWRLVYDPAPDKGLLNAVIGAAYNQAQPPGPYPEAQPAPSGPLKMHKDGAVYGGTDYRAGDVALLGLVAIPPDSMPKDATQAVQPNSAPAGGMSVVVWRDFKPGGGKPGVVENGEVGLPGATVTVVDQGGDGQVVARGTTGDDGAVKFSHLDGDGPYQARVASQTFRHPFGGIDWLGSTLVTYAIIAAFCWMWAGFSVVVVSAGLAALPRDVLEAARIDGAGEWKVFRHVTVPLLAPVLGVVFTTMVINVMKIFDIVLITAPGGSQNAANVIALEMYNTSFTARQYGLGSAVAVLLFIIVIPFMILNLKRFKQGGVGT
ncbi:MAG: ABC transporter permease subunit [Streptosporangiales bacterium]